MKKGKEYMGAFGNAVYFTMKRPFIILFVGLIMPIFCLAEYFLLTVLFNVTAIGTGNISESIVYALQMMLSFVSNPWVALKGLLYFLLALISGSILVGFVLSGYLNVVNNTLEGKPKINGEFRFGLKKYIYKLSTISFRVILLGLVFMIFMMVATIPALVITRAASMGRPEFTAVAIFIDILTAGVLFFGVMFFRLYVFFWYPAALSFDKNAFLVGKRTVDNYFWKIVSRFVLFDLAFVVFQSLFMYASYRLTIGQGSVFLIAGLYTVNWLFKTAFISTLVTYIFSAFKMFSGSKGSLT
ncbi:MAG: hypothetical protein N3B21_03790 [Clostridia bacterium]|nr:hypothetical protein [Clostridia bacterium]